MKLHPNVALATALLLPLTQVLVSCGKPAGPAGPESVGTAAAANTVASTNAVAIAGTNAPPEATNAVPAGTNAPAAPSGGATNGPPGSPPAAGGAAPPGAPPSGPGGAQAEASGSSTNEIQVSFQGAQVDMIVQWLAQTTGKTVIKHPRVQCQLTIVSSQKVPKRDAINLVYRALALEGYNAIETANSILIVPEGQDVKMNPEIIDGAASNIPEGRQRLMKIFQLEHVQPADLREKIKPVLSDKATVDMDEHSNRLIVTDFTDNIRLLAELIRELDVTSIGDSVIEVIPLKYAGAEELASLAGLILNSHASNPASPKGSSSSHGPPPQPDGGPAGNAVALAGTPGRGWGWGWGRRR